MNTAHAASDASFTIHLAPKILGHVFNVPITNTLITTWVVIAVLIVFAYVFRKRLKEMPGKFQLIIEELIAYTYTFVAETLENQKLANKVFPLILTIFIFVLTANWVGLLPGIDSIGIYETTHGEKSLTGFFHPATTDLNVTLALALISFFAIEVIGISLLGTAQYAKKFFNFKSPISFLVGIIELFSEFARLIAFSFRLFGNIFAGKTLILVAIFFVPYILPVPLMAFELFVGFIQAFIFAILTLFFIRLATEEPH